MTRLEVGSVGRCSRALGGGVVGGGEGGSDGISVGSSRSGMDSGMSEALAVSTDLLLEPPRDTLCRFLEDWSLLSKGFGRVEQGSEETARSRDNSAGSWSIWQRTRSNEFVGCREVRLLRNRKLKSFSIPQSMSYGECIVFACRWREEAARIKKFEV